MLKKITPLLFAALLTLAPVQFAAAWEEACVNFPLGKTWFIGHFGVVGPYGFKHGMPRSFPSRHAPKSYYHYAPKHTLGRSGRADVVRYSESFGANGSRCVNITHILDGEDFAVYVITAGGYTVAHCATPKSNPNMWMRQNARNPNRKIWWQAYGADLSPRCYFWRESN